MQTLAQNPDFAAQVKALRLSSVISQAVLTVLVLASLVGVVPHAESSGSIDSFDVFLSCLKASTVLNLVS